MIPIAEAFKIVTRSTPALGGEKVALDRAVGRILAEDVLADSDLPPFDRSQMDGYAVRAADTRRTPVTLTIAGESAAGRGWHKRLNRGEAVRIMTGAPVPDGADAVQMIERTREAEGKVEILEPTEKGRYIVPQGKEVKKGDVVLAAGTLVTTNMIATLAAFGYSKVKVAKLPRVAVIATGSELVEVDRRPRRDQIRNSNSPMLRAMLADLGIDAAIFPLAKDDLEGLKHQIAAAAKTSDIVILTGGVSVGKYDLTKPALAELGAEMLFDKVELKPGKPTVFARRKRTLFFGLPGNPVSVAVTFSLFVRKAIRLMQKASETDLASGFATLDGPAKGTKPRDTYLPASLATSSDGRLLAIPLAWHGSSDFIGFSRCDALVIVPKGKSYEAGEVAEVLFL
ncbi:MAG: gephyrin-like molybdotransferase Glp [Pyrinomonadaceae bacterium]